MQCLNLPNLVANSFIVIIDFTTCKRGSRESKKGFILHLFLHVVYFYNIQ